MSYRGGISFVVPVYNGARTLDAVLCAIERECSGRPCEILVVDDGSSDTSVAIAEARGHGVVRGDRRGAAAAINLGLRLARHDLVCQIDQDVELETNALSFLVEALSADSSVAAVQGVYTWQPTASLWARIAGLDLAMRYRAMGVTADAVTPTDHACTGNTLYRRSALLEVGGFDEGFGYGYDNDLSYRLTGCGYRLCICGRARSVHHWRSRLFDYLRQQYGVGYGRLDLIAKHRHRVTGDRVSGIGMILHAAVATLALTLIPLGQALPAACLVVVLLLERLVIGARAALHYRDPAALWFPLAHQNACRPKRRQGHQTRAPRCR